MLKVQFKKYDALVIQSFGIALILVLWELGPRLLGINSLVLPPFSEAVSSLFRESTGNGTVVSNLTVTVREVVSAFLLGSISGILVGLILGMSGRVRRVVSPLVAIAFAVPLVVLIPLFLVTFGLGTSSKVAFGTLYSFFPVVLGTIAGVQSVSPLHRSLAESLGLSRTDFIRLVVLRSAARSIFNGLHTALAMAIIGVVSIQMFGSHSGLGYLINAASQRMRTDEVFGLNIIVLLMGMVLLGALNLLSRAMRVRLDVSAD